MKKMGEKKIREERRTERGITLLALIITVVIMIILAAVTINVTLGEGGLVQQAQHAAEKTQDAAKTEQEQLDELQQELANILAENEGPAPIPETETQVANYADVDGNGTVDGVIYADLAIGGSGSGLGQSYTITKGSNFKKYKVTQESYSGSFGTGKVIAPITGSSGNERFYVMALTDVDGKQNGTPYQFWSGSTSAVTSTNFGTGETNTAAMKEKGSTGMWGVDAVKNGIWKGSSGWYIPSRDEWAAFAGELGVTGSSRGNYSTKNLSHAYWSSSQYITDHAWRAHFNDDCMDTRSYVYNGNYVRLGTTF